MTGVPSRYNHMIPVFIYEVVVDEKGNVSSVRWLRPEPVGAEFALLEHRYREAIRRWRYRPARKGGVPVAAYISVTVRIDLW